MTESLSRSKRVRTTAESNITFVALTRAKEVGSTNYFMERVLIMIYFRSLAEDLVDQLD